MADALLRIYTYSKETATCQNVNKWLSLCYSSSKAISFISEKSSTNTLIRCHQNAFRYFHGYPEEILYDNDEDGTFGSTVVIKRLLKQEDGTLNRQFEDFTGFYGFRPVLCRPYRGQTKGKVERTVAFVGDNFMVGIRYNSLDDPDGQAIAWCNKVNGNIHATTGDIPFERLKREGVNPLSREYIIDKINLRRVCVEILISTPRHASSLYAIPTVLANEYSVPAEYVGRDVAVCCKRLANGTRTICLPPTTKESILPYTGYRTRRRTWWSMPSITEG